MPNTGSYEKCYPERGDIIVGNVVYNNNYVKGPAIDNAKLAQNNGILVAGGWDNQILRNRVDKHDLTGIALVPYPETNASDVEPKVPAKTCADQTPPAPGLKVPDTVLWNAHNNVVRGNVVTNSGLADLGAFDQDASHGNCFADNTFKTSAPNNIEKLEPCEGKGTGSYSDNPLDVLQLIKRTTPESGDYKTQPIPPAQTNMPNALHAPAVPGAADTNFDVDAVKVPELPKS